MKSILFSKYMRTWTALRYGHDIAIGMFLALALASLKLGMFLALAAATRIDLRSWQNKN